MTEQELSAAATAPATRRVVVAEDESLIRLDIVEILRDNGFDVVGEAGDGAEAVRLTQELRPDVVLMDVSMPNLDGGEATRQISRVVPSSQVVMLTMHADGDVMARAIQAGAIGYLVKDSSMEEVVAAVRTAASGESVLSPGLATSMLADVKRAGGGSDGPTISAREEEVLQLVADGLSLPEVAAALYISVKTVKNHLASIYAKLDARDRTQAVLRAVRMGIIRLG